MPKPDNRPRFSKKAAPGAVHGNDGKSTRRCLVCGKKKRMFPHERMCIQCRVLSPEERKQVRAAHGGMHRRDIFTISGGLPSLGKRN